MNNRLDKEKGFISIFVLLVMVFLLVFVLVCFGSVSGRMKTEDIKDVELKEIYFERNNYSDIENYVYANAEDVIPIYNIMEFNRVGTGNSIQIKDMIYQCGISNHYLLKSDIWVDINEDILQNHVGFADFKLYSSLLPLRCPSLQKNKLRLESSKTKHLISNFLLLYNIQNAFSSLYLHRGTNGFYFFYTPDAILFRAFLFQIQEMH